MMWTENEIAKTEREWTTLAGGEKVTVYMAGPKPYALSSELGALRLWHKMQCGKCGYSSNLKSWYWRNDEC